MRSNQIAVALAAFSLVLHATGSGRADGPSEPAYPVGPPAAIEVRVRDTYAYVERVATPPWIVAHEPAATRTTDSALHALVARVSAMRDGDHGAWLDLWDPVSRALAESDDRRSGRAPSFWTDWWRDLLGTASVTLVREIRSGEFVVLTYRLEMPGEAVTPEYLEMTMTFRRHGDRWLATQDLASDPLLEASPWVTGIDEETMVIE